MTGQLNRHPVGTRTPLGSGAADTLGGRATLLGLLMAVVLVTGQMSIVPASGVGSALAVGLDAVLVRTVLVPAAMRTAGTANWWTPRRSAPGLARGSRE
ncbi:hypothetical protein [Nocardia asiatica]|uniref:hypothetical protein n=1 Tax=Nocardia asiatica TaxID=209252 RepID=UPI0024555060|nr:hypothetical protein [Nocardia asiatica]